MAKLSTKQFRNIIQLAQQLNPPAPAAAPPAQPMVPLNFGGVNVAPINLGPIPAAPVAPAQSRTLQWVILALVIAALVIGVISLFWWGFRSPSTSDLEKATTSISAKIDSKAAALEARINGVPAATQGLLKPQLDSTEAAAKGAESNSALTFKVVTAATKASFDSAGNAVVGRLALESTAQKAVTAADAAADQAALARRAANYAAALARANGQVLSGQATTLKSISETQANQGSALTGLKTDLDAHGRAIAAHDVYVRSLATKPLNVRYFKSGRPIGSATVTPAQ